MTSDAAARHWEQVYRDKACDKVSWFRPHLDLSLTLLHAAGFDARSRVLDVGGGASTLVDDLLARGCAAVTVLDLSAAALDVARRRLGARAADVDWRVGDVTTIDLPSGHYTHWHDRAVLHFLTEPAAAGAYAERAGHALAGGGHAVIGGFAPDGPERCSGLPVARRSPQQIAAVLGPAFSWALLRRR